MKNIKKIIPFLFLFVHLQIQAETIRISTIEWCPYICLENTEKPGLLIEYTREIFKNTDYEIKFHILPWRRAIQNTEKGFSEATLGVAKHEAPNLLYTENEVGIQKYCFFTTKSNPWKYQSPESVIGKKIIYPQGALPEELEEYKAMANLDNLSTTDKYFEQSIRMLLSKRTEIVLASDYSMMHYLQKNKMLNRVQLSGCTPDKNIYLAFTANPKKKHLIEKYLKDFDKAVTALRHERYFQKLLEKYQLETPE